MNIVIPVIIILVSCAGILYIVLRRMPALRILDVSQLPEEHIAKVKETILFERLSRVFKKGLEQKVNPKLEKISEGFNRWRAYLKVSHSRYQKKSAVPEETVSTLLETAHQLLRELDFENAEKNFLEVIRRDKKNLDAYRGLANVYEVQGDKEKVREMKIFLEKLTETK